uniref:Uncharacterized protein n=1 Tax=Anopheles coluzzii TaxID=1518534 RepID=A0A8W7PL40_ANOCL
MKNKPRISRTKRCGGRSRGQQRRHHADQHRGTGSVVRPRKQLVRLRLEQLVVRHAKLFMVRLLLLLLLLVVVLVRLLVFVRGMRQIGRCGAGFRQNGHGTGSGSSSPTSTSSRRAGTSGNSSTDRTHGVVLSTITNLIINQLMCNVNK